MSTSLKPIKRYDQRHICQLIETGPERRARELAEQLLTDLGLELAAALARDELVNHILWLDAHHEELAEHEEEECLEVIRFDHLLVATLVLNCKTERDLMLVHRI
jgi:hypothetical protein